MGKATVKSLAAIGITEVEHLRGQEARRLRRRLEAVTGRRVDPCLQDVFHAAIAQAENPELPPEKCRWYYWSKIRKAGLER